MSSRHEVGNYLFSVMEDCGIIHKSLLDFFDIVSQFADEEHHVEDVIVFLESEFEIIAFLGIDQPLSASLLIGAIEEME